MGDVLVKSMYSRVCPCACAVIDIRFILTTSTYTNNYKVKDLKSTTNPLPCT
jgi:hypothetical protein